MSGLLLNTVKNILPFKYQLCSIVIRASSRHHFQRPNEKKRFKHGYYTRLLTFNGRKILMRRILKGRHLLGH